MERALAAEWAQSGRSPIKFSRFAGCPFVVLLQLPDRDEPVEFLLHLEEPSTGNMIFSAAPTIEAWRFWRQARLCNSAWLSSSQENKRRITTWAKDPRRFYRARSYMAPHFIEAWSTYLDFLPLIKLTRP